MTNSGQRDSNQLLDEAEEILLLTRDPEVQLRERLRKALELEIVPPIADEVSSALAKELVARLGKKKACEIDTVLVCDRAMKEIQRYMSMRPDQWPENGLRQIALDIAKEYDRKMSPRERWIGALFVFAALMLFEVGIQGTNGTQQPPPEVMVAFDLSTLLSVAGSWYVARRKGRSRAWALLGLLNWVGIILAFCLKNQSGVNAVEKAPNIAQPKRKPVVTAGTPVKPKIKPAEDIVSPRRDTSAGHPSLPGEAEGSKYIGPPICDLTQEGMVRELQKLGLTRERAEAQVHVALVITSTLDKNQINAIHLSHEPLNAQNLAIKWSAHCIYHGARPRAA